MSFRKSSVVIIDCGRRVIRAGRGVGEEILPGPTIELLARVGRRKDAMQIDSGSRSTSKPDVFLVGPALDEAEAAGEILDIFWPFDDTEIRLWPQAEAIWRHILFTCLQLRRTQNEYPLLLSILPLMSRVTHEHIAQICFERLNVAGLAIFDRPLMQLFAANAISGVVVDISQEATDITPIIESEVYRYGITAIPIGLHDCELYLSHTLKRNPTILHTLNTPDPLSPDDLDAALVALIRMAWHDGIIQVPHIEGSVPPPREDSAGIEDIAAVLVSGKEKAIIEAASARKKSTAQEKKAAASAAEKERLALDLVDVEFNFTPKGKEERTLKVTIGRERHQFCEPLFDPALLLRLGTVIPEQRRQKLAEQPIGLQEAIRSAVATLDTTLRPIAWDGVFLTGDSSVKNLEPALHSRLMPYLVRDPENQLQAQAIALRMLKVPDYFAEYRDKGSLIASYLGACIAGKLTFADPSISKGFITKNDYGERGPTAIREFVS